MKLIDFTTVLKERNPRQWFEKGKKILDDMHPNDADAVFNFMREYSLIEIAVNMGIINVVDKKILENDELFYFSNEVQKIYDHAAKGCFFCMTDIDPNTPYSERTHLCLTCRIKANKLLAYYGLNIKGVYPGLD